MMKTTSTTNASILSGLVAAIFCSMVWLGAGLTLFEMQGGVV